MDNPFKTISEAFSAGLEKLHKRADTVEADVKGFASKIETNVSDLVDVKDRLSKIEAMFSSDAVAAIADKVSGAGSSDPAIAPAPVAPVVTTPTPAVTVTVVPAAADPVSNSTTGVTTDPGTTSHVDTSTGETTVVPHDGTTPTATDSTGATTTPSPAAVAAATTATADAGVTVPAAS